VPGGYAVTSPTKNRASTAPDRTQRVLFKATAVIFISIQSLILLLGWFGIEVVNTARAYSNGESFYSKAEKAAVLSLRRYAQLGAEQDYASFLSLISVPAGDNAARAALEKTPSDEEGAAAGFVLGRNDPDDVKGMIRLYRWARHWGSFAKAVSDWSQAVPEITSLKQLGENLHEMTASGASSPGERLALLGEIDATDQRLTALEDAFSRHVRAAARDMTELAVAGLVASSILLLGLGTAVVWHVGRRSLAISATLRASSQRFKDFAEVTSDWFWETGPNLEVLYVSERFGTATGVEPKQFVGLAALSLVEPFHSADRGVRLDVLTSRKAFRSVLHRYVAADGIEQFWQMSGRPVFDAKRRFLGYRGTGNNVTDEIRTSIALAEAMRQAEAANVAKSRFLAHMSHELRTPLNAILGFSEVIQDDLLRHGLHPKYIEYAADIHSSGVHLLQLINDILDLSKIEAGQASLDEEEVDIAEVVRSSVRLLKVAAYQARVSVSVAMPPDLPHVRGDERRLKQVLMNLLTNAVKFTLPNGRIETSAEYDEATGLQIRVSDTGIGIAEQDIGRALKPFGQVEGILNRRHQGTGLGLPLAKELIEMHGGTLDLRSRLGEGTKVTITLPNERCLGCAAR
jgi:PAS domain S-box-containing protein